jgi:Flp pilus assembly protein TadG
MPSRITQAAKNIGSCLVPSMLRRLARDGRGATALEFALIGPAFIAMLVAILQMGAVFFLQQVLQTATTQASRLIMTGQAQTGNISQSTFLNDICTDAGTLFTCANMSVGVQTFSSFGGVSMNNPVSNGTFSSSGLTYTPGGPGDIVLVQVFYQLPVYAAPLGFNLATTNNNMAVLIATAVFRNEPYQ